MRFEKGNNMNPNGRPKGSKNKRTKEISKLVEQLIQGMKEQVTRDINQLTPSERIKAFTNLLPYVVPKQQAISMEARITQEYEQLKQLLEIAPNEAVEAIANKINELRKANEDE